MKKILFSSLLAASLASTAFGQGQILLDNSGNANGSLAATSGGLFFINGVAATGGQIHVTITGGPDSITQTEFVNNFLLDYSGTAGQYLDFNGDSYAVPGVALSGTATLHIFAWIGSANSYAAATTRGVSTFFTNPTGGGGTPAALPSPLSGMSAINLTLVPEPSTFALAGLGLAGLLIFRRRK